MSSHQEGAVSCPQCKARSTATVRQIIAAHDLPVKAAFLQGRLNQVRCPQCQATYSLAVPTLYYDLAQGFAYVFVAGEGPTDPAGATSVGELTRALRQSLPPDKRAPYLARPKRFASLAALIRAVLATDGITEAMLHEQAARAKLLDELLQAPSEAALKEQALAHDAELDRGFFELLTASMQAAHMAGDQNRAQTLLAFRTFLGQHSTQGRQAIAAIDAQLGLAVIQSREELLAQLRQADDAERAALVAQGHVLLDQSFFQLLDSAAAEAAQMDDSAAARSLAALRATLPGLIAAHEAQTRAALERAANLFSQVVSSPKPDQVLEQNRAGLDEAFFMVLGANIERARRQGQPEPVRALELIGQLARTMRV